MREKCVLTLLELNWNQRLGQEDNIEHLSSYAHVVHTTAKQVISRRRKNENVFKISKDEKCTCKACKIVQYCFSLSNMQICGVFFCPRRRGCLTLYFQTQICNSQFTCKEEVSWCESRDTFAMANSAIVKVSDWIDLLVVDILVSFSFLFFHSWNGNELIIWHWNMIRLSTGKNVNPSLQGLGRQW